MAEYDLIHRDPKKVLARDGMTDIERDRHRGFQILAECQDKPIRRITCAADIPRPDYWLRPKTTGNVAQEKTSKQKRDAVLAILKNQGPLCKAQIEERLGFLLPCDSRHAHSLAAMRIDRLIQKHGTAAKGKVVFWEVVC